MASYLYERDIKPEDLINDLPRELSPKEKRANWWHYHWYYVALCMLAVLALGYYAWQRFTATEPDCIVTIVSTQPVEQETIDALQEKLTALSVDENNDGKINIEVKGIWLDLRTETQDSDTRQLMESSKEAFNSDLYLCQSMIFIVDDPAALEQMYGCFRLLDGTDPKEGDVVRIEDFAVPLENTELADLNKTFTTDDTGSGGAQTKWYLVRRVKEGAEDAAAFTAGEHLWGILVK